MKKLLTIILTLGLLISMTACSSETKEVHKAENSNKKPNASNFTEDDTTNKNDEVTTEDGEIIIKELSDKTLDEAIDAGYDLSGYASIGDTTQLFLQSSKIDDNVTELKKSIEGMTVSELVDKYDVSIGYSGFNGEYIFTIDIGSVCFSFDLENGVKALEAHEDESFFDLEEADEIQNDKLKNISVEYINITADLDDTSNKKVSELEDIDTDIIESMKDEIVISKAYYTVE